MKVTDKQCAVILMRNWLFGGTDPLWMNSEEMSHALDCKRNITDKRREKILDYVRDIREPFEVKIENLYSKIEGQD